MMLFRSIGRTRSHRALDSGLRGPSHDNKFRVFDNRDHCVEFSDVPGVQLSPCDVVPVIVL